MLREATAPRLVARLVDYSLLSERATREVVPIELVPRKVLWCKVKSFEIMNKCNKIDNRRAVRCK